MSYHAYSLAEIMYSKAQAQWIYSNNKSGYPLEQDRHYIQQKRLFNKDHVDFELGGTSNLALNETSKSRKVIQCNKDLILRLPFVQLIVGIRLTK